MPNVVKFIFVKCEQLSNFERKKSVLNFLLIHSDGTPDFLDTDSDNDFVPDVLEGDYTAHVHIINLNFGAVFI